MSDTPDRSQITSSIKSYVRGELVGDRNSIVVEDDTALLESHIIDSLSLLKLVVFIEERFEIKVEGRELIPQNFATINTVTSLVISKLASKRE